MKSGCSIYLFPNSANLICRCTDISKYFRESLGLRDNESRLYINPSSNGKKKENASKKCVAFLSFRLWVALLLDLNLSISSVISTTIFMTNGMTFDFDFDIVFFLEGVALVYIFLS